MLVASLALATGQAHAQAPAPGITYKTIFQDPGATPSQDLSLENHAVSLINSTPAGERITFAFRDFNRQPVASALIAAHQRGVIVDGVIDGGERARPVVGTLLSTLGPSRLVLCGSPDFVFNSCIANTDPPSLQHNKFLTFSRLADGREHVVLQTSKNFFATQLTYYNDMVEITGDTALYDAYVEYLQAMKAQVRSDDHYIVSSGDDGRNTIFQSPRRQPDRFTADTIVDRMNEIDCSAGGSSAGKGLIRIANMAFRSERIVILHKLRELEQQGCDIEIVLANADGDIMAGLASARIPVHPLFLRQTATRPEVIVHDKFWLVDALSTVTGARTKVTYAGSSNWRGDQQRSDDLLLRIVDDGVYAAYSAYWGLLKSRSASDLPQPTTDDVPPSSAIGAQPPANSAGWNNSDVTLRVAASDGHLRTGSSGVKRLHIELSGAQTDSIDVTESTNGTVVRDLEVATEGTTTVTYFAEDNAGREEARHSFEVRLDKTAPTFTGMPADCVLWPPNHRLVHVADIEAADSLSGLAAPVFVTASSADASDDDIVISGGSVYLRAEKGKHGRERTYTIGATATDLAGNTGNAGASCRVPKRSPDRP